MSDARLKQLRLRGVLEPLDLHFALTLARLAPGTPESVLLAAALASRAVQQGHVCADLPSLAGTLLLDGEGQPCEPRLPALDEWLATLQASPLVADGVEGRAPRPLVLDARGRLYLYRYARYQQRLIESLRSRAHVIEDVDLECLRDGLGRLFPASSGADEQRRAAAVAVLRRLTIISGGPGTGKTHTVARILALLHEQRRARQGPPLRVKALAPTGKAAQRLVESMTAAVGGLACADEVRRATLVPASTIHRALGFQPRTPTRFRHDAESPLPADVVLVDEASMVDLALMAKLTQAVSPHARLILLGDKDQLASVEAGSILADIHGGGVRPVSVPMAEALRAVGLREVEAGAPHPGLGDGCLQLSRSRRYAETSGIGALARAVNAGDGAAALAALASATDLRLAPPVTGGIEADLKRDVLRAFSQLRAASPADRLALLARFKILCAHRRGLTGAETVNAQVEALLAAEGVVDLDGPWYDGRPILITANDPDLELFNGDVGVVCREGNAVPLAHFPTSSGQTRTLAPARLPPHETVFAMTVHKSQGSEFEHVALLLPEKPSAVLTRELIYTAVTRAKVRVDVYGSAEVLGDGVARRVQRASGLGDALWADSVPPERSLSR